MRKLGKLLLVKSLVESVKPVADISPFPIFLKIFEQMMDGSR